MVKRKVFSRLAPAANGTAQAVDGAAEGPTGPTSTRSPRLARRKVGRLGAVISALLLAVTTVAVPASSRQAVALEDDVCTPSAPNAFDDWQQNNIVHNGVTICYAPPVSAGFPPAAMVQIVDLSAGAEIQIRSDRVNSLSTEPASAINQYRTREAEDWFEWILANHGSYPSDRLVSTTNASFFIDTSNDGDTNLSMPQRSKRPTFDTAHTLGWAYGDHSDAAWNRSKRILKIKGTYGAPVPPTVALEPFPTNYTVTDVNDAFFNYGQWLGVVGFSPLAGDTEDSSPRTFLGVSPVSGTTKVYILTTERWITLSEAQWILETFGSDLEIQLDGGGSTQTYLDESPWGIPSWIGRSVPDVIAVYEAP